MMFSDLQAFVDMGAALWRGDYIGLYPLPAVGLFAIMALVPFEILIALMTLTSIGVLVAVTKYDAFAWLFFVPVLQVIAMGQLDLLALGLLTVASPVSFALLTLKPQLFVLALPALLARRDLWKKTAIWTVVLWLPSFIARPLWIFEWAAHMAADTRGGDGASLWSAPIWFSVVAIFLMVFTRRKGSAVMLLNPGMRPYDYAMICGASLWTIPASWLAAWAMWQVGAAWPFALLGLFGLGGRNNERLIGIFGRRNQNRASASGESQDGQGQQAEAYDRK